VGVPRPFPPAKLVVAVIARNPERPGPAHGRLEASFGPIDLESEVDDFAYTSYYDREMGRPLARYFVSFGRLVSPDFLSAIKLQTNALEAELAESAGRTFNLDPGLLTLARFSLATTKESAHRIPLLSGIYAELTLKYERGAFRPQPWTYPDYRSGRTLEFFQRARARLHEQLRQREKQGEGPDPLSL
jgi:hypothetical protein